ncbi:MAG: int [Myxococcaceae bacterium]|nr:int [Myxococcaceae bacterium]
MAVAKIKGSWWVDFSYNAERMRKRSPLNTRSGAAAFEGQLRHLVAQHGTVRAALAALEPEVREKAMLFAQFAERWMRDYVAVHNKHSEQYTKRLVLRTRLLPAFGALELASITTAEVDRFKRKTMESDLKPKSINNYLTILRKCLSTAVDWGLMPNIPTIRLLKTSAPSFRYLTTEEVIALAAAADGVWHDMIVFAAQTGLRFSELTALEWTDINLTNRMVTVRRGRVMRQISSPKNYRIRHVPLSNAVLDVLQARCKRDGLVFSYAERPISSQTAIVYLHAACMRAGIAPHGWHVLRHTFASHLAQRGASLQALKELLGHSSITMVLRYAHLAPNYLAETIRLLEPAPPGMAAGRQPEAVLAGQGGYIPPTATFVLPLNQAKSTAL